MLKRGVLPRVTLAHTHIYTHPFCTFFNRGDTLYANDPIDQCSNPMIFFHIFQKIIIQWLNYSKKWCVFKIKVQINNGHVKTFLSESLMDVNNKIIIIWFKKTAFIFYYTNQLFEVSVAMGSITISIIIYLIPTSLYYISDPHICEQRKREISMLQQR